MADGQGKAKTVRKRTSRISRYAALLALALSIPAATPAHAAACENTDQAPTEATVEQSRNAVLCLLNRERTRRHMGRLRENARLRRAAQDHTRDMVQREFFEHVSPGGGTMLDRLKKTGYVDGGGWTIGENIAWGTGQLATPASIVRSWMHSPGHRANILRRRFREVGIGVSVHVPVDLRGSDLGATYTTDFGVRS